MSQFLSQTLSQQMRLEQRLTPQLIQSMAILQKPVADLEAYVESALESNAALELAEPAQDESEPTEQDDRSGRDERADGNVQSFAKLDRLSRDYGLDVSDRPPAKARRLPSSDERDAKMGAMANAPGRDMSLHEHLHAQWTLVEVDDAVREAGEAIINHLDPDGYLRVRLEVIAESVRPAIAVDVLERALGEVQKLEPAGIGARDALECLLLQLDALPGDNRLERTLIERHLDDITHNRLPAIVKATGYSIGEINEAIKAMRASICLHPGYLVGDRSVPAIRPDVIVDYAETGGGLTVRLARGNMPELRIREEVTAIAKSKENGKETREFARKHITPRHWDSGDTHFISEVFGSGGRAGGG